MAISFFTSPQSALRQQMAKFESSAMRELAVNTIKNSAGMTAKLVNYQDFNLKRRTKLELFRLCLTVAGIEYCYAAETAFVSPIILRLHVPVFFMTFIWAASPLLGLILNPILGSLSDTCRSPIGRRRPFILGLTVGIILGLLMVPNGVEIGRFMGEDCSPFNDGNVTMNDTIVQDEAPESHAHQRCPLAIVFTLIGVMLLDFCCDASQSPCRTYLLDVCHPEDHTSGLSMFTVVSGLGGALGYIVGGIDWGSSDGAAFMTHVKIVFMAALGLHTVLVVISLTTFKEMPLGGKENSGKYQRFDNEIDEDNSVQELQTRKYSVEHDEVEAATKSDFLVEADSTENVSIGKYLKSIIKMPSSIVWLCLTNLCCWMSLLCYSLYFTDFVGQSVYGGSPTAHVNTVKHDLYSYGVKIGSFAMSLYSITCSLYSLVIERLVAKVGARTVYIVGQVLSCCGSTLIAATKHPVVLFICSPSIGVLYATLFTMPYILLAHYHDKRVFEELAPDGNSQTRGLGTDVAVLSSMVFVGQFLLSCFMGSLLHVSNSAAMWSSAVLSGLGALSATRIFYNEL